MNMPKFPHLENLDRAPQVLQAESVLITEKIDGFNARFGRTLEGTPWAGTRNQTIDPETQPTQGFGPFVRFRNWGAIDPGVTLFGEWAGKGIQKRIDYGEPDFYLFAGLDARAANWMPYDELLHMSLLLSLKMAPVLWLGAVPPLATLEEMRVRKSQINPAFASEGIVLFPRPMVLDKYGHDVIAKFKNPEFEERASKRARTERPIVELGAVEAFVAEYATAERLDHVLSAVAEDMGGSYADGLAPQAIGTVLRAMYNDVIREGEPDYLALSEDEQKHVGRVLNKSTKALLDAARMRQLEAVTGS